MDAGTIGRAAKLSQSTSHRRRHDLVPTLIRQNSANTILSRSGRQTAFLDRMACDERAAAHQQRRALGLAAVVREGTARMERAAGRRVDRVRYLATHRQPLPA